MLLDALITLVYIILSRTWNLNRLLQVHNFTPSVPQIVTFLLIRKFLIDRFWSILDFTVFVSWSLFCWVYHPRGLAFINPIFVLVFCALKRGHIVQSGTHIVLLLRDLQWAFILWLSFHCAPELFYYGMRLYLLLVDIVAAGGGFELHFCLF